MANSDAAGSAAAAVIGRRPSAGAAVAVVAQSLGAGVLPANNAASFLELGTRDELAAAQWMRKVALLEALDDAAAMDNHLRLGLGQRASLLRQPVLVVVIVGGNCAGATLGGGRREGRAGRRCGGGRGQGRLGGGSTVDFDVLVRPAAALLATC